MPSRADARFLTQHMLRFLRNSRHLRNAHLGYIRVDELKHMLEWRIGGLDAILCDPDGRMPAELLTVVQEMLNQWKSGKRTLRQVRIDFPYRLPLDPRLAVTCLGPDYLLKHVDGMAAGCEELSTSVESAGTLRGPAAAIELAKPQVIKKTLCNDVKEMATVPGFDFYRQIPVPQDEFGPVIETCGAMLRRIAADANSKITVKENESSCGAARIAHVWSRTEADLETATSAFHQFCKERSRSSQVGTEETLFVEVPNARVGQFVKAIPSIKAVTGAEIRLGGNWDDEGKPYRLFSITGTADEFKQAKEICQKAASDKPYIPTAEQLAQLTVETVELNPWAGNAPSAVQPRALLPPWLNDMQPVPLNFRSPSADQYGPQPDNAHKWLEYYRKVGLVDHRVIDALIKGRGWKQ
ncbi:unnamed protein product, partial [Mesorhabditis spiculigera]